MVEQFFPKTEDTTGPTLPGSLHAAYVRCGKATCRCAHGELHGPYWKRHWSEGGRMHKAYVRLEDVDRTRAAVARWRQRHPSVRSLIRELRALWRLVEEDRDGA